MKGSGEETNGKKDEKTKEKTNVEINNGGMRLLTAGEIECRTGTVNAGGLSLLLFKDARADQKILDETYGPMGWKRSHQSIDGNLYCTVEVWDTRKGEWIGKQDVGTAGYTEKEKGQASDSFKRACVNWGIGRELYTAPFIWIPASKASIKEKDGKYVCYDRFRVSSIEYNERREISGLSITDGEGREVYAFRCTAGGKGGAPEKKAASGRKDITAGKNITAAQMEQMERELARTGVDLSAVLERYHLQDAGEMTADIYESAMKGLRKSKPKTAA